MTDVQSEEKLPKALPPGLQHLVTDLYVGVSTPTFRLPRKAGNLLVRYQGVRKRACVYSYKMPLIAHCLRLLA